MEYFVIIILMIIIMLILKFYLNINIQNIKKLKTLSFDENTNEIIKNFPENAVICKDILKMLNNDKVKIEETKDEKSTTSLYMVMQNKILIGNVKSSFTRIQTIAHECIHSIQNKTLLKFNFITANVNMLYFFIICILAIFNITNKETNNILLILLLLLQFTAFSVRNFLECDAMKRAEILAKEYIEKVNLLEEKNRKIIENKYKEINKIGIKLYTFMLLCKTISKPILYCIILILSTQ